MKKLVTFALPILVLFYGWVFGQPLPALSYGFESQVYLDKWLNQSPFYPIEFFQWQLENVSESQSLITSHANIKGSYRFLPQSNVFLRNEDVSKFNDQFTKTSVSFEIWFKPFSLSGKQVIYEFGGSGEGTSLTLNQSSLDFVVKDKELSSGISIPLTNNLIEDFIQVISVINLEDNTLSIFLNGKLIANSVSFEGKDWAGNSGYALGSVSGGLGGNKGFFGDFKDYTSFDGEIALFNIYSTPLSNLDVLSLYSGVSKSNQSNVIFASTSKNEINELSSLYDAKGVLKLCPGVKVLAGTNNNLIRPSAFNMPKEDQHLFKDLRRFNKALNSLNINLAVVYLPPSGYFAYPYFNDNPNIDLSNYNPKEIYSSYRNIIDSVRETGVYAPDIISSIEASELKQFYMKRDHHWSPFGAGLVARALVQELDDAPWYLKAEKHNYITTEFAGSRTTPDRTAEDVEKACHFIIPQEEMPQFTTQLEAQTLFSETPKESVVLFGNSNSERTDFNFDGFLEEYSHLQVLNLAKRGTIRTIFGYLASGQQLSNPIDLIVWQVNRFAEDMPTSEFRKLIPSVYGKCSRENSLPYLESDQKLKGLDTRSISFSINDPEAVPAYSYISLQASGKDNPNGLSVAFYGQNNTLIDELAFDYSEEAYNNVGKYFAEFPDTNEKVYAVTLQYPMSYMAGFEVQICKPPI